MNKEWTALEHINKKIDMNLEKIEFLQKQVRLANIEIDKLIIAKLRVGRNNENI